MCFSSSVDLLRWRVQIVSTHRNSEDDENTQLFPASLSPPEVIFHMLSQRIRAQVTQIKAEQPNSVSHSLPRSEGHLHTLSHRIRAQLAHLKAEKQRNTPSDETREIGNEK